LQSKTPSKQQIDQMTDHTKKTNVSQASTPSTQKSTTNHSPGPDNPPIPGFSDQIKTVGSSLKGERSCYRCCWAAKHAHTQFGRSLTALLITTMPAAWWT
jgi:hypothetical protein